jgi:hypothetical protein
MRVRQPLGSRTFSAGVVRQLVLALMSAHREEDLTFFQKRWLVRGAERWQSEWMTIW